MQTPKKATHKATSVDGRIIYYFKGSNHWYYLTRKSYLHKLESARWQKCLAAPTLTLERLPRG